MTGQDPETRLDYRLRGVIDGRPTCLTLVPGANRVGSSSSADIRLTGTGVSREHALITVGPQGVVVEDRGSTNGTYIDTARVGRIALKVGARLRFGSVELVLEQAAADDEAALAIVLPAVPQRPLPATDLETAVLSAPPPSSLVAVWLAWLDAFLDHLGRADGLRLALEAFRHAASVRGVWVVSWPRRDVATLVAASGSVGPVPPQPPGPQLTQERSSSCSLPSAGEVPGAAVGILNRPENGDVLGLFIGGSFPGRDESAPLLRALVRLCSRLDGGTPPGRATVAAAGPDLVFPPESYVGTAATMETLHQQMRAAVQTRMPVLLHGETGVGKELVARTLHASSARAVAPFVAVNCAALPAELMEAELFGIERGVATGVVARIGTFARAEGGTLFLDEVGELDPSLQAKLLRVLQESEVQPVGGTPRPIDVWIISATNVPLADPAGRSGLRADLYYRLAGHLLEIPALRDRRADIPGIVAHFLARFRDQASVSLRGVTVAALDRLERYPWPGNIRELEHEMRRLTYQCADRGVVDVAGLSKAIRHFEAPATVLAGDKEATLDLKQRVAALEGALIREGLERTDGRHGETARLLGLSRNGLAKKMKRFGIVRPHQPPA